MKGDGKVKEVFHISEREGKKSVWVKIGVAFVNKDGSINVLLDSIPMDGKLHIRERNTTKERG